MINAKAFHPDSGVREGLLIDLDNAARKPTTSRSCRRVSLTDALYVAPPLTYAYLQCTIEFLSTEILLDRKTPQTDLHDLESFFYALVWGCTFLAGPNGKWRGGKIRFDQTVVGRWRKEGASLKLALMTSDACFHEMLGEIHPYFAPLKALIAGLRKLFHARAIASATARVPTRSRHATWAQKLPKVTHNDVLAAMDRCLSWLPLEDPQEPIGGWKDKLAKKYPA